MGFGEDLSDFENLEVIGMNGGVFPPGAWKGAAILRNKESGDCFLAGDSGARYSFSELKGYEKEGRLRLLKNPITYIPGGYFLCVHPEVREKSGLKLDPFPLIIIPELENCFVRYMKNERVDQLRKKWLEDNLQRARTCMVSDWDRAFEIIRSCVRICGGDREEFVANYIAMNLVGVGLKKISTNQLNLVIKNFFIILLDNEEKRRASIRGKRLAEFYLSD